MKPTTDSKLTAEELLNVIYKIFDDLDYIGEVSMENLALLRDTRNKYIDGICLDCWFESTENPKQSIKPVNYELNAKAQSGIYTAEKLFSSQSTESPERDKEREPESIIELMCNEYGNTYTIIETDAGNELFSLRQNQMVEPKQLFDEYIKDGYLSSNNKRTNPI